MEGERPTIVIDSIFDDFIASFMTAWPIMPVAPKTMIFIVIPISSIWFLGVSVFILILTTRSSQKKPRSEARL